VYSPTYKEGDHHEGLSYLINNNIEIKPLPQERN